MRSKSFHAVAPVALAIICFFVCTPPASAQSLDRSRTVPGYKGLWFTLGQFYPYGDKYSGGLGTYTAKHHPLAIYAPAADRTFFVFGGTTQADERHLLNMIGYYDHARGVVPQPVVVHDKEGVDDPHDNSSLSIDDQGHLWVFVSGRAQKRPGFIYRSNRPYDISAFEQVKKEEFAYPQPWWIKEQGFLFLFTRYTDGRELYWKTSPDGNTWSEAQQLVSGGHYQMSNQSGRRVITAFNAHPDKWNVDGRTNLYFLQTDDRGETWRTVEGQVVSPPLDAFDNPALVRDYRSEGRNVYLKDIQFDRDGDPVLLYITSRNHKPGPPGAPRRWTVASWKEGQWHVHDITRASHNYDMGSLYVEDDGTWRLVAPTGPGPQYWGTGGEVEMWTSADQGRTWKKRRNVTMRSERNHSYVRRPVNAHPDFYSFWADGNPDVFTPSRLYFTNKSGSRVWGLPYRMDELYEQPELQESP